MEIYPVDTLCLRRGNNVTNFVDVYLELMGVELLYQTAFLDVEGVHGGPVVVNWICVDSNV